MAEITGISWTDATVNYWWGCTKVGPGCDHCYAETWSKRSGKSLWGIGAPRRKIKGAVALLRRLDNGHSKWEAADHRRRRVFTQSMSDLFDLEVPLEWFDEAWTAIELSSHLDIQIVTKRISVVEKRLAAISKTKWPRHVGLMITVTNQAEANRDIPRLIALKQKFGIPWIGLSIEPILGPIDITSWVEYINWVIVGGESGAKARPADGDWFRFLRDQCATAKIPFLFKQHGEWIDVRDLKNLPNGTGPGFGAYDSYPYDPNTETVRVGKKIAGNLLDGCRHHQFVATSVDSVAT